MYTGKPTRPPSPGPCVLEVPPELLQIIIAEHLGHRVNILAMPCAALPDLQPSAEGIMAVEAS